MLTLETGEGVADADSFVSVADARAFASSRGLTLPQADGDVEILLRRAADYINAREARFQGDRLTATQALAFPRRGLCLYGKTYLEPTTLPRVLTDAVCQLAVELKTQDAQPNGEGREVVTQTVGPISTTYSATGKSAVIPVLTKVEAFLEPLYRRGGATVTVERA